VRNGHDAGIELHIGCIVYIANSVRKIRRKKISYSKSAKALKWRGYYPLLPLWVEYRNVLRAGRAVVVKSAARPLHVLMEAHAGVDKRPYRR